MIGAEWRSRGTLNTWSRLPQDVSGRWHGYPLLAWVSFLKERGKGKRERDREREGREEEKGEQSSRGETDRERERERGFSFFPLICGLEKKKLHIQRRYLGTCEAHADQRWVLFLFVCYCFFFLFFFVFFSLFFFFFFTNYARLVDFQSLCLS